MWQGARHALSCRDRRPRRCHGADLRYRCSRLPDSVGKHRLRLGRPHAAALRYPRALLVPAAATGVVRLRLGWRVLSSPDWRGALSLRERRHRPQIGPAVRSNVARGSVSMHLESDGSDLQESPQPWIHHVEADKATVLTRDRNGGRRARDSRAGRRPRRARAEPGRGGHLLLGPRARPLAAREDAQDARGRSARPRGRRCRLDGGQVGRGVALRPRRSRPPPAPLSARRSGRRSSAFSRLHGSSR